jgi:hypothetical protein
MVEDVRDDDVTATACQLTATSRQSFKIIPIERSNNCSANLLNNG